MGRNPVAPIRETGRDGTGTGSSTASVYTKASPIRCARHVDPHPRPRPPRFARCISPRSQGCAAAARSGGCAEAGVGGGWTRGLDRARHRSLLERARGGGPIALPDGTRVAFRTSTTGSPQIWVAPAAGGPAEQITFGEPISEHAWSPSGEWIFYGCDRGERAGGLLLDIARRHARARIVASLGGLPDLRRLLARRKEDRLLDHGADAGRLRHPPPRPRERERQARSPRKGWALCGELAPRRRRADPVGDPRRGW